MSIAASIAADTYIAIIQSILFADHKMLVNDLLCVSISHQANQHCSADITALHTAAGLDS